MTRRFFVAAVGGLGASAAIGACGAVAQREVSKTARKIPYLFGGSAPNTVESEPYLRDKLHDLGHIEGRDIAYQVRLAGNVNDRLRQATAVTK